MTAGRFTARPAGDHARLIELPSNAAVHRYAAAVIERLGTTVEDVVRGHQTVLVSWAPDAPSPAAELEQIFNTLSADDPPGQTATTVTIPVRYDGPDLDEVARATGLSTAEVCALHASRTYTAGFIGFSPGFAYLLSTDPRLRLPRRTTPRVTVPRGAVAIAGEYSAVYPSEGPGGWHIIGHTETVMFDPGSEHPFLVTPGTRVTFEPVS